MSDGPAALRIDPSEHSVSFWIHVTPRARQVRVAGLHGDALRVSVSAPPVEGKANAACVVAISHALGVKRSLVQIDPASKGRRKRVRVEGAPDLLSIRLHTLADAGGVR